MNPSIPEEIVKEIFSWLPIKSLMRFKCVTKFINSLVSESDFTDTHTHHSMTRPSAKKLVLHEWKDYYTADQQKEDEKIPASIVQIQSFDELPFDALSLRCVNGLFCTWEILSNQPAAILNPSTREVRFLPKLNDSFFLQQYSLGFEPEENKYKILAITHHDVKCKYWVFTLGKDESWREAKSPPHILCISDVYINGVIYKFSSPYKSAIVGFDVKTEAFNINVLMNNLSPRWDYKLTEVKGKLAVIDYENPSDRDINLRVLKQTGEEEWEHHIFQFPSTIWMDIQQKFQLSCCTSCDGEILFVANLESVTLCICYDVTRQSWRKIEMKGLPKGSCITSVYPYVERLVM